MSGVFISYRREETAAYAGRIRDRLVQEFGQDQIFMDIDTIELGVDFTKVIDEAVAEVDVLLCIIGRNWLTIKDGNGKPRIDDPTDFVHLEIANAIKRDIRVIPILVKNAEMPTAHQLPPDLLLLSKRNTLKLSDTRFHTDVDQLIKSIQKQLHSTGSKPVDKETGTAPAERGAEQPFQQNKNAFLKWLIPLGLAVLLVVASGYFWQTRQQESDAAKKAEIAAVKKIQLDKRLKAEEEAKRLADLEAKRRAEEEARRLEELQGPELKINEINFGRNNHKAVTVLVVNDSSSYSKPKLLMLTIRRIGKSKVSRTTQVSVPAISSQSEKWITLDAENLLPRETLLEDTSFILKLYKLTSSGNTDKAEDVIEHN